MLYLIRFIASYTLALLLAASASFAAESTDQQARQLLDALGCKGCHTIQKDGGSLGPPLDQVGSRLTSRQIQELLRGERDNPGQSIMPSYETTPPAELKLLSDYLYNLNP